METFSKKEKEKQRQKKRKEKQEKREERKANGVKGQSLDQMMAYVDENGNITSTPPADRPRPQISEEDIIISVPRRGAEEPADTTRQGVVTFFNTAKGYGFIRDLKTQESIFVHANALTEPIGENDKVRFSTVKSPKGLNATDVAKV